MRVLIVASSLPRAEGVARTLRYAPGFRVCGWLRAAALWGQTLDQVVPEVVVIDLDPDGAGLEHVRTVRTAVPGVKAVGLAENLTSAETSELLAAGLDGIVMKTASGPSVGLLIREIVAGHVFSHARTPAPAVREADPIAVLTTREREILTLVAGGLSNGGMAERLWVTEQTIKFHLSNIYRKLGLANRTQAARFAHVHGLLDPEAPEPAGAVALRPAA